MLMLMPPYHGTGLRADENGIMQHFARVADAARIPIMVQDAPLSGVNLSVPFLVRLAREIPLVRYFKIEMPGTAAKLRSLIEAGGDAIAGPFDGEESITLMADLDAGATGTMPSALLPGTDVNFPASSDFGCGSSISFASSFFASCVFACDFSVCPCAASIFGCAACCPSTAVGAKPRTTSRIL